MFPSIALALVVFTASTVFAADATAIGSRREMFVDDALIERLVDGATLRLHEPTPREIVLVHDAPWEGSGSGYHTVFRDGDRYRMYYKASQLDVLPDGITTDGHKMSCCYAESDDGIHWRKPELGLHEFNGSKANNIVIPQGKLNGVNADAAHPAMFKDENPAAPADARYKAIVRSKAPRGALAYKSPDGLNWLPMQNTPVLTDGAFDSQNLAFWDTVRGEYRAYWRAHTVKTDTTPGGRRSIRTATSKDFLHWENQADVTYVDSPLEQLYTNQVKPYYRAPHILIGFPTRYTERNWSESLRALPEREHREARSKAGERYGTAITEALMMASRDGVNFKRWNEAFLRPGIEREGTWNYGHQYLAWHVVETKPVLEGAPNELSLYATESYWTGTSCALRRYTLRLDGFVSVNAPMKGGEIVTKPITFTGSKLLLNFATSAAGSIRVEIQDTEGRALSGFTQKNCEETYGDAIERQIAWTGGKELSSLAGKQVRLRFVMKDADLYAYRFQ